jgi:hypothetical protein
MGVTVKSNYLVWAMKRVPNACVLDELSGVDEEWKLTKGTPLADGFPQNAVFRMDPEFPNNTVMTDSLRNTDLLIVGSLKLAQFLQSRQANGLEYLPVAIANPKKKIVSKDYCIIHPTDPVDCLDVAKSGARWSKIDKQSINAVKKLVLQEDKIDPKREVFRLQSFFDVILVKRDLAEAMDAQGFTGIRWIEPENYPS